MSLGNLGTFAGRKGTDKEQCRHTHAHTQKSREEILNCRERHKYCGGER